METNRHPWLLGSCACLFAAALIVLCAPGGVDAQEKKVETKTLVTNLENPSGLAIHPPTGHVFIASRYGVYRFDPKQDDREKRVHLEIDDYKTDIYGKGPKYNIGPLGLGFLGDDHLVVGGGSRPDGEELVRVYKIDLEKDGKPHKHFNENTAAFTLGPIKASEQSAKGEGNFYGVAVSADAIFITCNGDDTKGWIAKAEIKDGKPGELKLSIASKVLTEVDAPGAATFTPDGKELLVGQIGEVNVDVGDSLLTFYDPKTGKLNRSLKTSLLDIAGLAYSPKTKKLYATDFAWANAKKGALYRLDIEGDTVKATKIIDLDKPAALAFDKEGRLYLTVFGTEEKDSKLSPGKLLRIDAGL